MALNTSKEFPRFYIETNDIWQWVNDQYELTRVMDILIAAKYDLTKIRRNTHSIDDNNFGTRREHRGLETLFDFLASKDVDISKWTETHRKV